MEQSIITRTNLAKPVCRNQSETLRKLHRRISIEARTLGCHETDNITAKSTNPTHSAGMKPYMRCGTTGGSRKRTSIRERIRKRKTFSVRHAEC